LSPDAYDALSAEEKRALWVQRKQQRANAPRRQNPSGGRKLDSGHPWVGWAMVCVLVGGAAAWELKPAFWFSIPALSATGAKQVRASFGFCHTGGGYNCVVDGDTIWIEGQDVRIADIDAPETHEYGCQSEKDLGDRATRRLNNLVNSGPVTLSSIDRDEDVYGRKLRLVFVNGVSVGDTLVNEGLARYYRDGKQPWC
jgi:endonuclease YncB( thermonuclease family)